MRKSPVWLFACLSTVPLPAQAAREAVWKTLAEQDRLVELKWRRDAAGDLEYAPAAHPEQFARLFADGVAGALGVSGSAGPLMFVLHSGDVLSLTDGERHLRRLGRGMRDGDLVALVRSPVPAGAADVELLDRLVAIDVLNRRDTAEARAALAAVAADQALAAALRARAKGDAAPRQRLDPALLPLPATADCYIVVDHARTPDGAWIADLGRFTGLLASAKVLTQLKEPREDDYLTGETESETITELPFEIVRRLGNLRLDHTCAAFSATGDAFVCCAGVFDPAAIAKGSAALGGSPPQCRQTAHGVTLSWPKGKVEVTDHQLLASRNEIAKPRPEFATRLLALEDAAVRVSVPKGSGLLQSLPEGDLRSIEEIDGSLTFGPETITLAAVLRAADAAGAAKVAAALKNGLLESGAAGWAWRVVAGAREALRVEAQGEIVRVALPVQRAKLPTRAQVRAALIEMNRR